MVIAHCVADKHQISPSQSDKETTKKELLTTEDGDGAGSGSLVVGVVLARPSLLRIISCRTCDKS